MRAEVSPLLSRTEDWRKKNAQGKVCFGRLFFESRVQLKEK